MMNPQFHLQHSRKLCLGENDEDFKPKWWKFWICVALLDGLLWYLIIEGILYLCRK